MKRHTCIICGKKRNAEYMQAVGRYGQGWHYVCKKSYGGWDDQGKTCKEKYDDQIFKSWSWKTPEYIYDVLNKEFHFDFDPCPINSDFDGLKVEWGLRNYVCPPYIRNLKESFIKKAFEESNKGKICVLLLPVSTSTRIFHEIIYKNAEIRFLRGRIKFIEINNHGVELDNRSGMHDSMVVIFRGNHCDVFEGNEGQAMICDILGCNNEVDFTELRNKGKFKYCKKHFNKIYNNEEVPV